MGARRIPTFREVSLPRLELELFFPRIMVLRLIRSGQSLLIPTFRVRTMAAVSWRGKHTLPELPYGYDVSSSRFDRATYLFLAHPNCARVSSSATR